MLPAFPLGVVERRQRSLEVAFEFRAGLAFTFGPLEMPLDVIEVILQLLRGHARSMTRGCYTMVWSDEKKQPVRGRVEGSTPIASMYRLRTRGCGQRCTPSTCISRWTWGAPDRPVLPLRMICWPVPTVSPT